MFYYPNIELTEFERQYVALYDNGNKPGVLRRLYNAILNTEANSAIPELNVPHLSARVQISRRSRVFMLSFAGDAAKWRMHISKANGEHYTATNPGAPQNPTAFPAFTASGADAPIVAAMCPGALYSAQSTLGVPPTIYEPGEEATPLAISPTLRFPVVIEPNWQLDPNEQLIFTGFPLTDGQLILEIGVHVWEFPNWKEC